MNAKKTLGILFCFLFPLQVIAQEEPPPVPEPIIAPTPHPNSTPVVPTSERAPVVEAQPVIEPTMTPEPTGATVSQDIEPTPEPEPAPVVEEKLAAAAKKLAVGLLGRLKVGATVQGWYDTNDDAEDFQPNNEAIGTFRLRRAQLKLSGEIIPDRFSFGIMTDLSRANFKLGDTVVVQNPDGTTTEIQGVEAGNINAIRDLYGELSTKYVNVKVGQFKIPLSLEGVTSGTQQHLPERTVVARKFGNRREIGAEINKKQKLYEYQLGIFNGSGENRQDNNSSKDLTARFNYTPTIGNTAKFLFGIAGMQSIGPSGDAKEQVIEGDFRVELGGALFQTEVIVGNDTSAADDQGNQSTTQSAGFYVTGGYTYLGKIQGIARFGMFDPNMDLAPANDTKQISEIGLGINYFFLQNKEESSTFYTDHEEYHNAKIQLGYYHFMPTATGVQATDQVILALQTAF